MPDLDDIITDPTSITPEWLSENFERRGLKGAKVSGIRERARVNGLFSTRVFYDVLYAPSAPEETPRKIFLKLSLPDSEPSQDMIRQEVEFYRSHGDIPALPLVRYFAAAYSAESGAAHLLLEDLSDCSLRSYRHRADSFPRPRGGTASNEYSPPSVILIVVSC